MSYLAFQQLGHMPNASQNYFLKNCNLLGASILSSYFGCWHPVWVMVHVVDGAWRCKWKKVHTWEKVVEDATRIWTTALTFGTRMKFLAPEIDLSLATAALESEAAFRGSLSLPTNSDIEINSFKKLILLSFECTFPYGHYYFYTGGFKEKLNIFIT